MNWKQKSEASWWAQSPQRFAGKFVITQQADGSGFLVEHLSTRYYACGPRPRRLKRVIGRKPALSEAQAAAAAFMRDELCWPEWPVETVDA